MLWAITAYFNPAGYRRRLLNYRLFRQRLPVPLITVECSFGRKFELEPGDADVLVQIAEGDVLWQKERLLNVAIESLPSECSTVAWLDCDIVFQEDDWPDQAMRALKDATLVHLFRERHHPPKDTRLADLGTANHAPTAVSTVHLMSSGQRQPDILREAGLHLGWTNGLAWAGRRDTLEKHGLYDACIVGSGDRAILCAALGRYDLLERGLQLSPVRFDHYTAWARPFHADVHGRVVSLDGRVFHLWHGELADRRHSGRHEEFARLGFNPCTDIARSPGGCWEWSSDKPELHAYVRHYFDARNEDG